MKSDVTYNKHDNQVMVKTAGDLIYVICHKEEQQDNVVKRMTTDNCKLTEYEEWDGQFLMTFEVGEDIPN